MTWKEVKSFLETLTDKQLEQDAFIAAIDEGFDKPLERIEIVSEDEWMWDGEDDPSFLKRKSKLDKDELEYYEPYFGKGTIVGLL